MPIVFQTSAPDIDCSLAVWDSTESLEQLIELVHLTEQERLQWNSITSITRQREFLTVRVLLKMLSGTYRTILYDANGKPSLDNGHFISISHSKSHVAIIISSTRQVGIDLEAARQNIGAIAPKFVSEEEKKSFGTWLSDEALHVIWGAKEVAYKLYGKGSVDFKKDLFVEGAKIISDGRIYVTIQKTDLKARISAMYRQLNGYMLVWAEW